MNTNTTAPNTTATNTVRDCKSFLATSHTIPRTGRYVCERLAPLMGESFQDLMFRLSEGGYNVPECVETSGIKDVTNIDGNVYLVQTHYSSYLVKVQNKPETGKKTYLAYAAYQPRTMASLRCMRLENDDFSQPVPVQTSMVLNVREIAKKIYRVETLNSIYFTAVIDG